MTWLDRDGVRLGYEELGTGDPPMVLVLGLERPVVVGHSLGGIVALALATVDTRRVHPRTPPCRPVGLGERILRLRFSGGRRGLPHAVQVRRRGDSQRRSGGAAPAVSDARPGPDRRRRTLPPARGSRSGQCHDRALPGPRDQTTDEARAGNSCNVGGPARDVTDVPVPSGPPSGRRRTQPPQVLVLATARDNLDP